MRSTMLLILVCALLAACGKFEVGQKVRVKSLDGTPIGTVIGTNGPDLTRVRHPNGTVADYAHAELIPVAEKE